MKNEEGEADRRKKENGAEEKWICEEIHSVIVD